jgi:hypothetical protein
MTTNPHATTDESTTKHLDTVPSTMLAKLWLLFTLLVGLPLTGYLLTVEDAFGTEGFGGVAGVFVGILTLIGVVRYVVKWLVLRRTSYVVTDDAVRRQYELFYKTYSRELPLEMLRSIELSMSRSETMLGFGTVKFLSVGSNRSMGYVEFEAVQEPEDVRDLVRGLRHETTEGNVPEDVADAELWADDDPAAADPATDDASHRGTVQEHSGDGVETSPDQN